MSKLFPPYKTYFGIFSFLQVRMEDTDSGEIVTAENCLKVRIKFSWWMNYAFSKIFGVSLMTREGTCWW